MTLSTTRPGWMGGDWERASSSNSVIRNRKLLSSESPTENVRLATDLLREFLASEVAARDPSTAQDAQRVLKYMDATLSDEAVQSFCLNLGAPESLTDGWIIKNSDLEYLGVGFGKTEPAGTIFAGEKKGVFQRLFSDGNDADNLVSIHAMPGIYGALYETIARNLPAIRQQQAAEKNNAKQRRIANRPDNPPTSLIRFVAENPDNYIDKCVTFDRVNIQGDLVKKDGKEFFVTVWDKRKQRFGGRWADSFILTCSSGLAEVIRATVGESESFEAKISCDIYAATHWRTGKLCPRAVIYKLEVYTVGGEISEVYRDDGPR